MPAQLPDFFSAPLSPVSQMTFRQSPDWPNPERVQYGTRSVVDAPGTYNPPTAINHTLADLFFHACTAALLQSSSVLLLLCRS
jgi:hypothetical protein